MIDSGVRLDEIRQRAAAASPAPWFYNSYANVHSGPKARTEDDWWEPRLEDGHSYGHRAGQVCEACGPRFIDVGGRQVQTWDCARSGEALDADSLVCSVPPSYGDTATGQRKADAEFIAAAPEDIAFLLALVDSLTAERDAHRCRDITSMVIPDVPLDLICEEDE